MSFLTPPFIIAMLLALSIHEAAHGFVAYRLGDPTAKYAGRLTLNPLAHLDFLGTILFLVAGFGWGKPVPVDPRYFRNWKRDTALVSLAGPASNFLLATIAFACLVPIGFHASSVFDLVGSGAGAGPLQFIAEFLADSVFVNLGLMAFNLLPVAPLDGSKIVQPFIPLRYEDAYERFLTNGPYVLLFLLISERFFNVSVLGAWIGFIVDPILKLFSSFI